MRILYLGRADEFADTSSLALVPKQLFQRLMQMDENVHVTWVAPGAVSDETLREYLSLDMPDPKRLRVVKTSSRKLGRMVGYFMTNEMWDLLHPTKTSVPYDIVLNQHFGVTPMLKTILTNKYGGSRYSTDVPLVNWHVWTLVRRQLESMPEYYAGEADLVAESMSALFGRNVWESQIMFDDHLATLREYLRPGYVKKVEARSEVVPIGVGLDALAATWQQRQDRIAAGSEPALFWGGRLAAVKRVRESFPLMESVQKYTGARAIVSTSYSGEKVAWVKEQHPRFELHENVSRSDFWSLAAQGDVFLCNSQSESYGIAWLEMLGVGQLGVFMDKPWVRALLPDWYPFVTDSKDVQVSMATALLKQWPDGPLWKEYAPRVRDWLREEHDEVVCARRMLAILEEEKRESLVRDERIGRGSVGQLAHRAALELWNESPLDREYQRQPIRQEDVFARMTELSVSHREWGLQGDMVTGMYLRRALETNGWHDLCLSDDVEYVR